MTEVLSEKKSGKSKASKASKKTAGKQDENKDKSNENQTNDNKNENTENAKATSSAPEQVISTRAYLEQNVTSVIQEAMLECARKRPPNPLEFVGNFILDRAHGK